MDAEAMQTMLKMEGDMFAITKEEPSDHSAFIMLIMGQLNSWTWFRFSENMGKKVYNASPIVLFNIFNKMNSNLAYFDVSHNFEIPHINDSKEFENEINKKLEWKIEPKESTFETLNLGNNETPHLIIIASTLNEKEKKISKSFSLNFKRCLHGPMKIYPVLISR